MNDIDTSGPAFPQTKPNHRKGETEPDPGASRRDYFAAHALAGYCANPQVWIASTVEQRAQAAVIQADAMLAALKPVEQAASTT
jgi:hypothetical protein